VVDTEELTTRTKLEMEALGVEVEETHQTETLVQLLHLLREITARVALEAIEAGVEAVELALME
jgi:EAL domain-containing protein (putative c-di-GMP-specific phosphodiesterase class I)